MKVLGKGTFKVSHVTIRVGYQDRPDVPKSLAIARKRGLLERNLDLENASYIVSRMIITAGDAPTMRPWRKSIFMALARNSASPVDSFRLPPARTIIMGSQVYV